MFFTGLPSVTSGERQSARSLWFLILYALGSKPPCDSLHFFRILQAFWRKSLQPNAFCVPWGLRGVACGICRAEGVGLS